MDLRRELPYRAEYTHYDWNEVKRHDVCNLCHQDIEEDTLRFAVESHVGFCKSRTLIWHHFSCFFTHFRPKIQEIAHYAQLRFNDQKKIKTAIKRSLIQALTEFSDLSSSDEELNNGVKKSSKKKRKKEKIRDPEEVERQQQSDIFYENLKFLETMKSKDLIKLLETNKIDIPLKFTSKCDRLADAMTFGRLLKCPECKKGQLVFRICGYICSGYAEEVDKKRKWFRCDYQTRGTPKRKPFEVSENLKQKYQFLKNYSYVSRHRIYDSSLSRVDEQIDDNSDQSSD